MYCSESPFSYVLKQDAMKNVTHCLVQNIIRFPGFFFFFFLQFSSKALVLLLTSLGRWTCNQYDHVSIFFMI